MGFDFRPALKESIKEAGIPRGWSLSDHRGHVRLRVRAGVGGTAASWTKVLPMAWEIGCIGPATQELVALHKATSGEEPKTLSEAWLELHPEDDDEEPAPGVPTAIGGINWKKIANNFYRDRQVNGKRISDATLKLERTYCDPAVQLLSGKRPPATPYKLIDQTITHGGWTNKPRARQQCAHRPFEQRGRRHRRRAL